MWLLRVTHTSPVVQPVLSRLLEKYDSAPHSSKSSLLSPFSRFVSCVPFSLFLQVCLASSLPHSLHLFPHSPIVNRIFPSGARRPTQNRLEIPDTRAMPTIQPTLSATEDQQSHSHSPSKKEAREEKKKNICFSFIFFLF